MGVFDEQPIQEPEPTVDYDAWLRTALRQVALARAQAEGAKKARDEAKARLEASDLHLEFTRAMEVCKLLSVDVSNAEDQARRAALAMYGTTLMKHPVADVEIKLFKELTYDPVEARTYALMNLPQALALVPKTFEKIVLAMPDEARPGFVSITMQPKALLASDLSGWLEETRP